MYGAFQTQLGDQKYATCFFSRHDTAKANQWIAEPGLGKGQPQLACHCLQQNDLLFLAVSKTTINSSLKKFEK